MLLVLNRLYQQTEDVAYLAQAEAVFQGIQPLWDSRMELYHSPYSTESQGAQTDEYSTLSSQNYLLLGLMEMYRNTGDEIYRNEVVRLLQSIRTRLYSESDRLLVHHWVDGRPAGHDDPDFFCSDAIYRRYSSFGTSKTNLSGTEIEWETTGAHQEPVPHPGGATMLLTGSQW